MTSERMLRCADGSENLRIITSTLILQKAA